MSESSGQTTVDLPAPMIIWWTLTARRGRVREAADEPRLLGAQHEVERVLEGEEARVEGDAAAVGLHHVAALRDDRVGERGAALSSDWRSSSCAPMPLGGGDVASAELLEQLLRDGEGAPRVADARCEELDGADEVVSSVMAASSSVGLRPLRARRRPCPCAATSISKDPRLRARLLREREAGAARAAGPPPAPSPEHRRAVAREPLERLRDLDHVARRRRRLRAARPLHDRLPRASSAWRARRSSPCPRSWRSGRGRRGCG